jgi:cell division transport system permease protein
MSQWLNHHLQALKLVIARMRTNLLSSFMISLVIGVALCIPALFYIGADNLSALTRHMQSDNEISLFLKLDADADSVAAIEKKLADHPDIQSHRFVSKEEAWQDLQAKSASNPAVLELNKNPLPDAFFIQATHLEPQALEALRDELQQTEGVEQTVFNADWAKRLAALLALGKQIIYFVAILLAIALLVIIGNTVRMQILTQKDEIEVSKLIGATNGFIRMPFLYAGILYGLVGACLAILMLIGMLAIFNHSVGQISSLYNSDFRLPLFNHSLFIVLTVIAVFIGWLGSYIAVSRAIQTMQVN